MGMAFMASDRIKASTRPSFVTPRSFFNWGKGAGGAESPPQLKFQYHDVELPFPMSLVANTHLRGRELKCCYKATVDGFSATDFHRRCDFQGPCVIVGYTGGGFRFGGFSPEGYRSPKRFPAHRRIYPPSHRPLDNVPRLVLLAPHRPPALLTRVLCG